MTNLLHAFTEAAGRPVDHRQEELDPSEQLGVELLFGVDHQDKGSKLRWDVGVLVQFLELGLVIATRTSVFCRCSATIAP